MNPDPGAIEAANEHPYTLTQPYTADGAGTCGCGQEFATVRDYVIHVVDESYPIGLDH